jgi:type I restriction enzyme S subunit
MSSFKTLREIVTFKGGGTPSKAIADYWDGPIPWATVKDFTSTRLSATEDSITELGLHNSSANLIPRGHVVIPTRMSLGKAAINDIDLAINQDLRALIPKVPLDADYLLHAILSLKEAIVRKGSGATVKGVTQDELYQLKIFFPPINGQTRIAHLLGKVEGLIAQRKQHLQQLDDLLKSVFLQMFGDPVRNEKGWNVVYWDDLFVTRTGKLNANAMSESGVYPFFTCAKEIFQIDSFAFDCEALILAGNNATGDYDVKYYKGKFNAYQRTYILALKADTDEYPFFKHHLEMKLRQLKDGSKGANTRYLTKQFLDTIAFIQPGEEFQKKFSTIAKTIEALKSSYKQSHTNLEDLYGALSQQAFKGELDLLRVPLPVESITEDTKSSEGLNRERRERRESRTGMAV